jgi:predicted nucleotidyltransferase
MAQGNFREFLRGEVVWVKKYFYVLRPLLACRWIERGLGVVPIEFQTLVSKTVEEPDVALAIAQLLEKKRAGVELDRGPRVPALSSFIEREIARHEDDGVRRRKPDIRTEPLSELFRKGLTEVWGAAAVALP